MNHGRLLHVGAMPDRLTNAGELVQDLRLSVFPTFRVSRAARLELPTLPLLGAYALPLFWSATAGRIFWSRVHSWRNSAEGR